MKRGTFIVFEGLDGSGKSTQLRLLAEILRAEGREVVTTAEPYDGAWGRRIRAMARSGERVEPEEELRWFQEQRREHVRELVAPALARGAVVLSDRYFLSSVAYQGARGLDAEAILRDSEAEFPLPDLVLLLEVDAADGLRRIQGRTAAAEPAFEERGFQEAVARVFAGIDRGYLERVDARGTPAQVHAAVLEALRRRKLPA